MSIVLQNVRRHVKKCPILRSVSQQAASSSEVTQKIKIPSRIHRGPTDILKALATTLKSDPTATHYKYHDDPFLIPTSQYTKRSYALSKESGRKAAQWIREQHADIFQHKVAEPFIPVFAPRAVYDENSEVNEAVLKSLIDTASVTDAIVVYELMQKKEIEVSEELKQSLLELVCFYNGKEAEAEDLLEEKWFKLKERGFSRKTWEDGGHAESLFKSLKVQTPEAYCALIQGMAKYNQISQAMNLYEEMKAKKLPLSVNTFNALISVSNFVMESFERRWNFVENLLNEMKTQKCMPNLATLNSVLIALVTLATMKEASKVALQVLAEFRRIGIEPSLASFYHLLQILYWREGANSPILSEMVDFLENKELKARDPKDINFFSAAMNVCATKLEDVNLAYRLNSILHYRDNYNLIGDSYKESIFYRNFFNVVCDSEPIEEIMKLYEATVPQIYTPELSVMFKILQAVDMNGSAEYLPHLWSDIVLFELNRREEVLTEFANILYRNHTKEAPLCDQLADVGWAIWNDIENQSERRRVRIAWTGTMLGSVLQAVINAKRMNDAYTVFQKLIKSQYDIVGVPEIQTFKDFLQVTIEKKDAKGALICLKYCMENDFVETYEMAETLAKADIADGTQKLELEKLLISAKHLKEKVEKMKKAEPGEIKIDP